jgi:hypothetical protein
VPDTRVRERATRVAGGPRGLPRGQWGPGNHTGKLCNCRDSAEHSANGVQSTCIPQPCQAGARRWAPHSSAADTNHARKRVPVDRVAEREFSRKDTEERELDSSGSVQERQRGLAHVKGASERVDVG